MTSHNPAGYYGLEMNIIFQDDISNFDIDRLKQTLSDVVAYLNRDDQAFCYLGSYLSTGFDKWVETLTDSQTIRLIRWLTEILLLKMQP